MVGDAVRDKDASYATLLICETNRQKQTEARLQRTLNLYVDFGFYKEYLTSLTKKS
jgi:phosphomannomutase